MSKKSKKNSSKLNDLLEWFARTPQSEELRKEILEKVGLNDYKRT